MPFNPLTRHVPPFFSLGIPERENPAHRFVAFHALDECSRRLVIRQSRISSSSRFPHPRQNSAPGNRSPNRTAVTAAVAVVLRTMTFN